MSIAMGAISFAVFFVWNWITLLRSAPAIEILERDAPEAELLKKKMSGFVAMEYFWGILNRTFLVFVAPEGLYGWRALGPVSNSNRTYYEPYQAMLEDDEFMRDRTAIQKLARLRGGFFLDRAQIVSVNVDDRQKWGMGGILHSGRILVRLASGKSREFILLGAVIPDEIRDKIVRELGAGVTSGV